MDPTTLMLRNLNMINQSIADGMAGGDWDDKRITYDGSGNPTIIVIYLAGVLRGQWNITYDGSGNATRIIKAGNGV